MLQHLRAARVIAALRSGSSLPTVVETEDGRRWVVKLRGAGGGARALACEIIYGAFADAIGIPVPTRAVIEIPSDIPSDARHEEVLDVLRASVGLNLGVAFLPDAVPFVSTKHALPSPEIASRVLALDAFLLNVDRTLANPNLLVLPKQAHAFIDHGALLLFEHRPGDPSVARDAAIVRAHLFASHAHRFDAEVLRTMLVLSDRVIDGAVADVPAEWAAGAPLRELVVDRRHHYLEWRAAARTLFQR